MTYNLAEELKELREEGERHRTAERQAEIMTFKALAERQLRRFAYRGKNRYIIYGNRFKYPEETSRALLDYFVGIKGIDAMRLKDYTGPPYNYEFGQMNFNTLENSIVFVWQ